MKAGTGFTEYYAGNNPFGYVYGEPFTDYSDGSYPGTVGASVTGLTDVYPKPPGSYTWAERVTYNGATATAGEIAAVEAFLAGLETDNIRSKMINVLALPPSSIIACCTPVIADYGNALWTPVGFVIGDLTVNGLKGPGTTAKYLRSGVIPSNVPLLTATSGGMTIVVSDATPTTSTHEAEIGAFSSPQSFAIYRGTLGLEAEVNAQLWGTTGGDRVNGNLASNTEACYLSMNRIASNDLKVYKASTSVAHTTFLNQTTAQTVTARPTAEIFAFLHGDILTLAWPTPHRISFMAIHAGLTSAESAAFYARIATLRNAFGGGNP